jgi:hypothetical protein
MRGGCDGLRLAVLGLGDRMFWLAALACTTSALSVPSP